MRGRRVKGVRGRRAGEEGSYRVRGGEGGQISTGELTGILK